MYGFLITVHVLVSVTIILIVLLQRGKGADIGATLGGGGSQTLFGSRGAATFLGKLTTTAAIIFMVTSLGLAYLATQRTGGGGASVVDDVKLPAPTQQAPVEAPPAAPPVEQPTALPAAPPSQGR